MYHPRTEEIVDVLIHKTQTTNRHFFRLLVSFYMAQIASLMRCDIKMQGRKDLPISMYALNLMVSGSGKTHSMNLMEQDITGGFRENYMETTYQIVADASLRDLALQRASRENLDPDDVYEMLRGEFKHAGTFAFSFDSGTSPALKQMRHKLLLGRIGSINLIMDEIGSNLSSNQELLTTMLELFDLGMVKEKLIKSSGEHRRYEAVEGGTPTNFLAFGTPAKLFDGDKTEDLYVELLDTGYARRFFFGYSPERDVINHKSAEQLYEEQVNSAQSDNVSSIRDHFTSLADIDNYQKTLEFDRETNIALIQYRLDCEAKADEMKDHELTRKAEMSHRYFKAAKLAGAYSFVDGLDHVSAANLEAAIQLTEDSGDHFVKTLKRKRHYMILGDYLADADMPVTHADIMEDLPWYPKSERDRKELINLATAWGYGQNISIAINNENGIDFFNGDRLKESDPNECIFSFSHHIAQGYQNEVVPFKDLHEVTQYDGLHWCTHHFSEGHRTSEKAFPAFNLLVIDVDGGTQIDTANFLLQDYQYLLYTTKSHTPEDNRFRIVFPMSHVLRLDEKLHKEFMLNVLQFLPFQCDEQGIDIARKWLSHPGEFQYHNGKIFDVTPFIPRTQKAIEQSKRINANTDLTHLDRWFRENTKEGNRSHQLVKYGFMLVDKGYDFNQIKESVLALNNDLSDPIPEEEIFGTILVSVQKKLTEKE